jgi:choline kinase
MEGLSNQLYKVSLSRPSTVPYSTVLFRVYGEHVSSFYDPIFELEVFKGLSELQIGPKMIANGEGWRIEEFHESVVLKTSSLPNPSIYTQVAAQLGRLHKIHRVESFLAASTAASGTIRTTPICFERLDKWTREGVSALRRLPGSEAKRAALRIEEILVEIEKMRQKLHASLTSVRRLGYDVVFCHNDVQENNILLTPYGLRFIDFEYANFNFQSADIGNFFNEFTMDYIYDVWPFFKGDTSAYPSFEIQRMFASVYLSEYLDTPILESEHAALIDELLDSVHVFSQLSHLLWGMWSLVRAQQYAETFNSFDFVEYARFRFDSYWARKRPSD